MRVREVMTPTVRTVAPETGIAEIARIMREEDIGSVPVAQNERLVGMVTDRDIVVRGLADGANLESRCAKDVMSPKILYCSDDDKVEDVLRNMGEQQIRRLPVVNSDKRLVGVVSIGDLSAKARANRTGDALKEISRPAHH